jgi:polyisoprenoid-binding protein YceI
MMPNGTTTKWVLDPMHSQIQFKVKHLMISSIVGSFNVFEGALDTEYEDFQEADIRFQLAVNSIDTNLPQRDEHLKSDLFFDADQYPHITFQSTSFVQSGEEYLLLGDLTIKGITKPVKLAVEFGGSTAGLYGGVKAGFEVSGTINRKEFGLTWDAVTEAGSVVVGENIKLMINAQFLKVESVVG